MKKTVLAALSAVIVLSSSPAPAAAVQQPALPQALSQLKADKLKTICRRDSRALDLVPKVENKIAQLRQDSSQARLADRLEDELNQIILTAGGMTDKRVKADIDLLEAASGNFKPPTEAELLPLTERYKKLCAALDDQILVKDFDRILQRHDRFIRYTALGLFDKEKIAAELSKMEEQMALAPDIPFGRAELLRGLQDRRLAAVPKLCYLGTFPKEDVYLSQDRRSVGMLEEGTGASQPLETADLIMQGPDGQLLDLACANLPIRDLPFSPPLSLWMKARLLEGKVPAITFRLVDDSVAECYAASSKPARVDRAKIYGVQDILDGKLDDYFKTNFNLMASTKEAVLAGLFSNCDQLCAINSFGADGKTPFYQLFDAKIARLPADKAREEFLHRTEKGAFTKTIPPELCNHYGSATIPDGPERVRDAWKRVHDLLQAAGGNIAFYSTAGAFHGSKSAFKIPALAFAGTQAWNKLEYYWPGEGVLDWFGTSALGQTPAADPKGANVLDSIDQFLFETRSSAWQSTPVMLRGLAPSTVKDPLVEAEWITTVFQTIIPATFPNISIVFVSVPGDLCLFSREASGAYRTCVSSNKYYKWPLRFKMLNSPPPSASP